ncbi:hypothetical protein [Fulvivirga sediminis]|uniref:Uncharacterized protein n=1 Tax=Fulvivirga sediminis TaxID=2803949 RepID=A0A937F4V4_9BACT|nr:hypothetical protein [Fulvivirga sediminis]MBL3654922.1 hypothetical protein [Fulvivirga sediminis]
MTVIPHKSETLVLPLSAEQITHSLRAVTQPATLMQERNNNSVLFIGNVHHDKFRISRKVTYPQNYLPLIVGRIEASSRGCIIFLRYNLFFSSFLFLSFWSVFTLLVSCFFVFYQKEYGYACVAFAACLANYTVTILNFNKQIKMSRNLINRTLNLTP